MDGGRLQVGDLARASGKSVRAIHLYEQMGLLRPVTRSEGGFRLFDLTALERVRWIEKLQDLGFTLPQIRELQELVEAAANGPEAMRRASQIFAGRVPELAALIERLQRLQAELQGTLDYLGACERCVPPQPLSACSECQRPRSDRRQPSLVSGLVLRPHPAA